MNQTSAGKFDIREEIRLIPKVMVVVAVLVFLGIQALLICVAFRHDPHAPPLAVQVLIATLAGTVLGIVMLLVGYVNRDAKRRGMNYALWTVLVLLIPNAIGYIIYFVVRQPILASVHNAALRPIRRSTSAPSANSISIQPARSATERLRWVLRFALTARQS